MMALLRCKTVWAGLALIATGLGTWLADGQLLEGVKIALEGLGLIFLRSGLLKASGDNPVMKLLDVLMQVVGQNVNDEPVVGVEPAAPAGQGQDANSAPVAAQG